MLTSDQQQKFEDATSDLTTWPKMTDDPQVNCYIDAIFHETGDHWHLISEIVKETYRIAATLFANRSE